MAQLHSGTPVVPSKVQPVPNSSTAEKSALPQPINIPPAANPIPPVYPGAEAKAIEIPKQLVNPPVTPSGTQPIQKEPLFPIASTNSLQPNRPIRDQASKENRAKTISPVISNRTMNTSDNNYTPIKTVVIYKKIPAITTNKKPTVTKSFAAKKPVTKKKPR